ncbi:MAG TPA: hypothetical protein VFZ72_10260 [Jiangellaceae bacterium]
MNTSATRIFTPARIVASALIAVPDGGRRLEQRLLTDDPPR